MTKAKATNKYTKPKKGLRAYVFWAGRLAGVLLALSGLFYVATVNNLSVKGFVLSELEARQLELQRENEEFELAVMRLRSYENISQRAQELSMVRVEDIDYITVSDAAMAVR